MNEAETSQPAAVPNAGKPRVVGLPVTMFSLAVLAFGLLLWARFLLVTGHPRTAIAVPEAPAASALTTDPSLPDAKPALDADVANARE